MLKRLTIASLVAASFTSVTAQELPYPDTIIVLDVSNSMWGQIDGVAKILIAREVIGDLVTDLEEDIDFGLVAYGHRTKADCGDIETIVPVGELDPAGFKAAVNSLQPQGRTPLTAAVRQAADQLNYTTRSARIVLVSDGVESCEGDPAALAATLNDTALDLTVHVIGFDVSDIEDQSGLEALAKLNGGLYLTPETSNELKEDLNSMMEMEGMAHDDEAMSEEMMTATIMAPDTIGPRSRIEVAFTGPMGGRDYIGIAAAGADDVLAIARAGSSGTALLIAPRETGSYELRYYTASGDVLAQHMIEVK